MGAAPEWFRGARRGEGIAPLPASSVKKSPLVVPGGLFCCLRAGRPPRKRWAPARALPAHAGPLWPPLRPPSASPGPLARRRARPYPKGGDFLAAAPRGICPSLARGQGRPASRAPAARRRAAPPQALPRCRRTEAHAGPLARGRHSLPAQATPAPSPALSLGTEGPPQCSAPGPPGPCRPWLSLAVLGRGGAPVSPATPLLRAPAGRACRQPRQLLPVILKEMPGKRWAKSSPPPPKLRHRP